MTEHPVALGTFASLVAGLGSGLGALPVLLPIALTVGLQALLLGFGGGVMLAATAFSLVIPGTEAALQLGYPQAWAAVSMAIGILVGGVLLELAHNFFPHEHFFKGLEGGRAGHLKRIWLFVLAITLHNFPEGLAVGVGFGDVEVGNPLALTVGIALQNIPEGLIVATSLRGLGYGRWFAVGIALLTGLVEPVGGLVGAALVSLSRQILPWGMALAAGAMLFVISDEIIPESHRRGLERQGTAGVMLGFVVMLVLDVALA
ncbi:MAG: ZIP family metal transporter [Gloeomargarita sp. SKYBB_i_bin120]|nr:ZIP family metal transporter [Gloeomargarita sp. SKYB120]MDW8177572.1 ZIP family metal transporter [Gloeomargarita sp. SKYBB_i_bin120]